MEKPEYNLDNPKVVANVLKEYNLWRRGVGKYRFREEPSKNVDLSFSNEALGQAIDFAVKYLNGTEGNNK